MATAGVRKLLDNEISVGLNVVLTKTSWVDLEDYVDFVQQHFEGVASVTFSWVAPLGRARKRRDLIPSMAEVAPYLARALSKSEAYGLNPSIPGRCGVPFCILPGMQRFFVDYIEHGHGMLENAGLENPEDDKVGRTKLPICSDCLYNEMCRGIWKGYAEIFGVEEFKAVEKTGDSE